MTEKLPSLESSEQKIIRLLKERGIEDSEAKELLVAWTVEQEKEVEKSSDPEASILFNLKRARLYFKAGYVDEAFENFEAAREQALNESRDNLYRAIMDEMDQIEDRMELEYLEKSIREAGGESNISPEVSERYHDLRRRLGIE